MSLKSFQSRRCPEAGQLMHNSAQQLCYIIALLSPALVLKAHGIFAVAVMLSLCILVL